MIETRYIDLSEEIEKGIKEGQWKERLPGVMKLSRELNAGPATISKAFKLLAEKGLVTIDGKKGTYITQPGRGVKYKVIGVIGIKTDQPDYTEKFATMEKTARENKYDIIGIAYENDLFIKNPVLLLKFPVDGYIFMNSKLTFEIAAFLRGNGVPFVSRNNPVGIPGVNWVDFDGEGSLEKALRYLIALGHEKIAYLGFYNPSYNYSKRMLNTYKKVLSDGGFPFDESLFISGDPVRYYNIYGKEYLKAYGADCVKTVMKQKERPTAVLIVDYNMAYDFTEELKKYNLKVPEDISVIAYTSKSSKDDFFTTLFNDYEKRSSIAVKMLLDLLETPHMEAREELIEGKIIVKKSCSKREVENR